MTLPRLVCLALALQLLAADSYAQPGQEASAPPTGKVQKAEQALSVAKELFQFAKQHRQGARATQLVDLALSLAGYGGLRQGLKEIWEVIRNDPYLQEAWKQLKIQYKPTLHYSAYAGGLAESTGYAGLTAGASVDLAAPLCRYVGAEINTHGYRQSSGSGLAYDSRVTACLPWGPFSFELGYLRQRDLRVAVDALPSLPSSRYNSDGFELRIRGFRYIADDWDVSVTPADIEFRGYQPADDDTTTFDFNAFSIDAAFVRYRRYNRGFLQQDRELNFFAVRVSGVEELELLNLSSTVVSVAPFAFEGAHLGRGLYLSGSAEFTQGRITDLDQSDDPLFNQLFFTSNLKLQAGDPALHGSVHYQRLLVPDSEFRLIMEDRLSVDGRSFLGESMIEGKLFGALTRQKAAPEGTARLGREPRFGASFSYGRPVWGPFYGKLSTTAVRSYYADIQGGRLLEPVVELRAIAALTGSLSSD